jgi:hypothetical protein
MTTNQTAENDNKEFLSIARKFEKASKQMASLSHEIGELSKKKPDGPINKFKLGVINKLLGDVNPFLGDQKPFPDFTLFDEDSLPTNSDVKLILSLYMSSCRSKRERDARRDPETERTFWYRDDVPIVEVDSRDNRFYEDIEADSSEYEDDEDEYEDEEEK